MAVIIIEGVGEFHVDTGDDIIVTGRNIQECPGAIGQHLAGGIIGCDRRKHHSAAGIVCDKNGRKIWRPTINSMLKIKISYQVRVRGGG